ncbi:hypothetical protein JB92DRAFT_3033624, partial [Gautieria morchelliformis]
MASFGEGRKVKRWTREKMFVDCVSGLAALSDVVLAAAARCFFLSMRPTVAPASALKNLPPPIACLRPRSDQHAALAGTGTRESLATRGRTPRAACRTRGAGAGTCPDTPGAAATAAPHRYIPAPSCVCARVVAAGGRVRGCGGALRAAHSHAGAAGGGGHPAALCATNAARGVSTSRSIASSRPAGTYSAAHPASCTSPGRRLFCWSAPNASLTPTSSRFRFVSTSSAAAAVSVPTARRCCCRCANPHP